MGNSVVIVGSGSIRGINGNGKYTIKKIKSNEKMFSGEDTKKKKKTTNHCQIQGHDLSLFSSQGVTDLAPKFSHLSILSTFYMWHEVRVQLHFCFACGYLFVPSSFVEDPVCFFPPLKSLSSLAKYYLTINIVYFWTLTFTPFCISIFMPVLHCFITVPLF